MNTKIIRNLFSISFFFFITIYLFGQNIDGNDWQLQIEKDGVMIYTKNNEIDSKENKIYLKVKIVNSNTSPVSVEWDYNLWINDKCRNCGIKDESGFYHKSVKVAPRSKFVIDYSKPDDTGLVVFKRAGNSYLTKMEFANLKISK